MFEKAKRLSVDNFTMCEIQNLAKDGIPIAVDFDSTLALTDGYPNIVGPNGDCFHILRKWQRYGCKILLNTIRQGKDLEEAVVWCANCGFTFDGVNTNPEAEKGGINGNKKLYAAYYIDDKALGTPIRRDTSGVIRDHVDWESIDEIYTPMIEEIINKLNNK